MSAQSDVAVTAFDAEPLHVVVARNIRAEAARRGLTQGQLGDKLGINRVGIGNRYAFNTPWTLDELERVAKVFNMRMEALLARPEGFEPPTFWFGAEEDDLDEPDEPGAVVDMTYWQMAKAGAAQEDRGTEG